MREAIPCRRILGVAHATPARSDAGLKTRARQLCESNALPRSLAKIGFASRAFLAVWRFISRLAVAGESGIVRRPAWVLDTRTVSMGPSALVAKSNQTSEKASVMRRPVAAMR